jgi:hypothetical protein
VGALGPEGLVAQTLDAFDGGRLELAALAIASRDSNGELVRSER